MDIVKDFYENYYFKVFTSKGLAGLFNSLTHKKLESSYNHMPSSADTTFSVMEIGAGQGEHLKFVKHPYSSYLMVDIVPRDNPISFESKVTWLTADICSDNLELDYFDRIISTCVLHHVEDPIAAIENIKKCLKPGGTFSLFLPSDPGILNRLLRKFCVTPTARKFGFNFYEIVNAMEHKNHYWSLKTILEYQFRGFDIERRYYPFNIPFGNLSLFSVWQITSK